MISVRLLIDTKKHAAAASGQAGQGLVLDPMNLVLRERQAVHIKINEMTLPDFDVFASRFSFILLTLCSTALKSRPEPATVAQGG